MGRLRVRAIMLNGTCIVGYADTGTQPSRVNRLVSAALGRDDETVSDFIGSSLPRAFGIGSRLRPWRRDHITHLSGARCCEPSSSTGFTATT